MELKIVTASPDGFNKKSLEKAINEYCQKYSIRVLFEITDLDQRSCCAKKDIKKKLKKESMRRV